MLHVNRRKYIRVIVKVILMSRWMGSYGVNADIVACENTIVTFVHVADIKAQPYSSQPFCYISKFKPVKLNLIFAILTCYYYFSQAHA